MESKRLIEKVKVTSYENDERNDFELEYYIISTTDNIYGIEIQKKTNTLKNEVRCIKDILCSKEESIQLLKKLAKNKVTPVTFEYIIEDNFGMY